MAPPPKPILFSRSPKTKLKSLVVVGHEDEQADDHRDAEHVPADRDVVEQRQDPVGEDVHQRVEDEDDQEQQPSLGEDVLGVAEVDPEDVEPVERQQGVQEERRAVADRGDDADQADDVEPAGVPAPAGAAELRAPTSRGRPRSGTPRSARPSRTPPSARRRRSPASRSRSTIGPPFVHAEPKVVNVPARTEMIVNEIAKLVNARPRARELLLVAELGELALVLTSGCAGRARPARASCGSSAIWLPPPPLIRAASRRAPQSNWSDDPTYECRDHTPAGGRLSTAFAAGCEVEVIGGR